MDNNMSQNTIQPTTNPKGTSFSSAALVFGVIAAFFGLFLFWTPFVLIAFICGGLAILFSILSKGNYNKMEKRAKMGLIFGSLGSALGALLLTVILLSSIYLLRTNPEIRATTRESLQLYEETIENFYGEDFYKEYEELYGKKFDLEETFDQFFGE